MRRLECESSGYLGTPVLSCQQWAVGETEADTETTEKPAQYEGGEVRGGGDDDPAQSCGETGRQYGPLGSKPPSTVSAQQATNYCAYVDTAG